MKKTISSVGEKEFIRDFIKPYYNEKDDPAGVGDDCAMVAFGDEVALLSTDRVPSDLTAFKLGILDYCGLGDYLARLNLSDIAACGGRAIGLLLNLGLPSDVAYDDILSLCRGFGSGAERHGATVLGGDITSACELSISATSIGKAKRGCVLTRRGAKPGDSIFVSRPLGMTPAAFHVFLGKLESRLPSDSLKLLRRQFTDLEPMLSLGQLLGEGGQCGGCMDNTDGIGQSLAELSEASKCALVVEGSALKIPSVVERVGQIIGLPPVEFIFNGGADFSLVGTLRGQWSSEHASTQYKHPLEIIGHVEVGNGVWLEDGQCKPLTFRGWNYFYQASS
ncbi:MAG TPA: thiamine-phosphate kinase [Verrucomicrobiae bacterium]|jgi:thiamine-monophosphate kinase|nr:thiamine-phosphate kinase [Verrucomicrobiae bacterium]